jgi:hypothetical protein
MPDTRHRRPADPGTDPDFGPSPDLGTAPAPARAPALAHGTAARFLAGLAWTVLLLGVWQWGGDLADAGRGPVEPATGDMAAVGRPAQHRLPPAAPPLPDVRPPRHLEIPDLGVSASVAALPADARGTLAPPSAGQAATTVGWYGTGTSPGAAGTALLVGRADSDGRPAALHALGSLRPGETVRVVRDDGRAADFTVDAVTSVPRERLDAGRLAGGASAGRAELRLLACGGTFDPVRGGCATNVLVSAYLTGTGP